MQSGSTNLPTAIKSPEIQERVQEAEVYLGQGLFDEARQIYHKLLTDLGPQPEAGGDPAAQRSYEARRGFIQEQLALIDRQEAEFFGQEPPKAESESPETGPESEGSALFNKGQAFLDIGLFADAIQEFKRAADLHFQPVECALQIGKAHIQLGQHQEGIQVLERTSQNEALNDSDRNRVLGQLALGYEAAADKGKALEVYHQLAASDPSHSRAASRIKSLTKESHRYQLNLIKLHLKNKQFLKAVQGLILLQSEHQIPADKVTPMYEKILREDPNNKEALQQLSTLYRQVLDSDTGDEDTRLKFARLLRRSGQFDSAIAEFLEVVLEDSPQKMTALNELGECLMEQEDYDRVLELLGDALPWVQSVEPDPQTVNYYYLLGTACEKKDLHDQAQDYFQKIAAIDPEHEAAVAKVAAKTLGPLISRGKALLNFPVDETVEYQIQESLGQDGIQQIFRVNETLGGTARIARTLQPDYSTAANAKDFLVRWASEQAAMENRNILQVLDLAEFQGQYYLISEDFQLTLEDLLKEKTLLSLAKAIRLGRALLNALAYAHSHRGADDTLRKIFHLALNPRRVSVSGDLGSAKIADFGLLYQLNYVLDLTLDYKNLSAFELSYMAPEQFDRSPVRMPDKMKQAADLYSFGLVFYQALTGKLPFEGPSPEDFKKQHTENYPVPPRVHLSSIPANLDEAILKCLQKDPKKRWRTPTELDLELEKLHL